MAYLTLIILAVIFVIIGLIFIYCHWCAEDGGRAFGVTGTEGVYLPTVPVVASKATPSSGGKKCKCGAKFKGQCNACSAPEFVDLDKDSGPDFGKFGGDSGMDGGQGGKGDPIRGFLGNEKEKEAEANYDHYHPDFP